MSSSPIQKLETALVERLQSALSSGYRIEAFTGDIRQFDIANIANGCFVNFTGSRYTDSTDMSASSQMRTISFAIQLFVPVFQDAYSALEMVRVAVQGQRDQGVTWRMKTEQLRDQSGTSWVWLIDIEGDMNVAARRLQPQTFADQCKRQEA